MMRIANVLAFTACMLMIGAPSAIADDVSDELAEMRALVEQLKGQVEAQSEQIEHQGEVIREARIEQAKESDSRLGASGIAAFMQRLEVEGWVAGSYFWNFNEPANGVLPAANSGFSGLTYPFHSRHNSFQVDQVWFGIEHPVDAENRAGFRFDLVYGNTACTLGNTNGFRCPPVWGDDTSQYYVNQAYVQYLAPITANGILVKAGKFATLAGAEVAQTTANFNITRGNVYNLLQPIDHVGVLFSTDIGETGLSTSFGVMNDDGIGAGSDPDWNNAKSIMAQVGWSGETLAAAGTVLWGPSNFQSHNHSNGLFDVVVTWDPNESLATWVNVDYAWNNAQGPDQHAWGVATAARYAVTERLGVSGRAEWVGDNDGFVGWVNPDAPFGTVSGDIWGLTGTVDYALTSDLMVRAEVRYDNIAKRNSSDREFFENGIQLDDDQTTAGVEIVYEF
jgi:hypothetical protein